MKIQQLSIFLENKPGHINRAVNLLAAAGINLITLSLADTEQFGILRIIVKEWERAQKILTDAGFMVKITEVVAIEVADRPGGLSEVLQAIEEIDFNIEYMYAFTKSRSNAAVLLFRFNDTDAALKALQARGKVNLLSKSDLFQ